MDDFRTNAFTGGFRHNRWVACADYSMFTDHRLAGASNLRSDELTTTVGYELIPDGTVIGGGEAWLASGVGARDRPLPARVHSPGVLHRDA